MFCDLKKYKLSIITDLISFIIVVRIDCKSIFIIHLLRYKTSHIIRPDVTHQHNYIFL